MSNRELERRLQDLPVPGEEAAEERAWQVVRAAQAERTPLPSPPPARKLAVAFAAAVAAAAIALSPAGAEVVDVVRDVVGIDDSETKPALDSLPAAGELLVGSDAGAWIVHEDGSKRLLGSYGDATWSPRGLFVAATDGRQLVALDPLGEVRWTVTAPGRVREPRWSPSGFRIAYRSGGDLRVVAGDGTGDHVVARNVARVAPAWQPVPEAKIAPTSGEPGSERLSYVDAGGAPRLVDADTGEGLPGAPRSTLVPDRYGPTEEIAWSADGARFVAASEEAIVTEDPGRDGHFAYVASGEATIDAFALAPGGDRLAFVERRSARSRLDSVKLGRDKPSGALFAGRGTIEGLTWSPDGRWLLAGWRDADQWLFIRSDRPSRLVAIDRISDQFDPGGTAGAGFPSVEGWVLPER